MSYGLPQKPTVPQEGIKNTSGRIDVDHLAFPASAYYAKLVAHGGIGKFGRSHHSQHHLTKTSMTTSGPKVHNRKSNEDPAYEPPNGVGGLRMLKIGHRDANEDANARDLSKSVMMFMGIGGKEMTDL